ncbi:hypothetical protein G9A89_011397 [Geosiphon pyriformis]|nr:hypothetical protein G9A89_011397 [Geosiphon pyriformis]
MDLPDSSAKDSVTGLAGLGTQTSTKKKVCVENIYFCEPLYKKLKNLGVTDGMINLLTGPISVNSLHTDNEEHKVSWSSKVERENTSVSEVFDIENMKNTIAEKVSYMNFNTFETNDIMNNTTPKKMRTRTYVLRQPPKVSFFNDLNENKSILKLPVPKFLSMLKTRELAIIAKILVNDNIRKPNIRSNQEVIIKEIPVDFSKSALESFGHISVDCSVGENVGDYGRHVVFLQDQVWLANIYKKKQASIIHPVSFSDKTWAQVAGGLFSYMVLSFLSGAGSFPSAELSSVSLEHSLELLANQVSGVLKKLSFVELVPLPPVSQVPPLAVSVSLTLSLNSDMALDSVLMLSVFPFSVVDNNVSSFGSSSSKTLTIKVDGLKSKIVSLKALISLMLKFTMCNIRSINVLAKQVDIIHWYMSFDCMVSFIMETKLQSSFESVCVFMSGLDKEFFGARMAVIMNNFLACYVSKIKEVPSQVILVWLLFKDKLSVMILELYAGAFSKTRFGQALTVNFFIVKTINSSTFMVLDGDFNENGSERNDFKIAVLSVSGQPISIAKKSETHRLSILNSKKFTKVQDGLHKIWSDLFKVYSNGLLRNASFAGVISGAAAYFLALDISVDIGVHGLVSSTITEFWVKVKSHSGFCDNDKVNAAAGVAAGFSFYLLVGVHEHFLLAENTTVSNILSRIFLGLFVMLSRRLVLAIMWHLPMAVKKRLYNKDYPGVLCLLCDMIKLSDHIFTCGQDVGIWSEILAEVSM